jgi:hypothetical protein
VQSTQTSKDSNAKLTAVVDHKDDSSTANSGTLTQAKNTQSI